jgi:putative FmdB family regulatory protein
MPIYEYRCLDCSHEFELIQKFSDPPLEECPSCPGTVQKLISRSAFHLKGNGWYVTDYGRQGSTNGKSNTESSAEKSDTKTASETTSDNSSSTTKDISKTKDTSTTASAGAAASS